MTTPEFSRPIALDKVGVKEKSFTFEASDSEREAMAKRLGIPAVNSLTATATIRLTSGGSMVRLAGHVRAELTQICVVTLEPMATLVDEDFLRRFSIEAADETAEVVIEIDDEDPPDPVEDGQIDMGEAAAEHLALAMDPFPRSPGAAFDPPREPEPEPVQAPTPFAVLAERRKKE